MTEDKTSGPPINPPMPRPPEGFPGVMIRCPFDPVQRRHEMVTRILELRSVIPELTEEKTRLEGAIRQLDEIAPPQGMMNPLAGSGDLGGDDGPNGKPGPGAG
jgi:hypothetical protein